MSFRAGRRGILGRPEREACPSIGMSAIPRLPARNDGLCRSKPAARSEQPQPAAGGGSSRPIPLSGSLSASSPTAAAIVRSAAERPTTMLRSSATPRAQRELQHRARQRLPTPADRRTGVVRAARERDVDAECRARSREFFLDVLDASSLAACNLRPPRMGEQQPAVCDIPRQHVIATPASNVVVVENDRPSRRVRRRSARERTLLHPVNPSSATGGSTVRS